MLIAIIIVVIALVFFVVASNIKHFLVSVPEVTGLITVNVFTGELKSYGTGLHFRFPWEQVKDGNYLNRRLITVEKSGTYPSKDGPLMLVSWSYQYRPMLDHLDRYISADDSTIKEGLGEVGGSILSAKIAEMKADDCKLKQHVIEKGLVSEFDAMDPTPADLYGIKLVRVSLSDVDYEETVQQVRATQKVSRALLEIAANIKSENPAISDKDALNAAMIMHKTVSKTVTEVEGQGGEALAALLIAMAQGGGKEKK